MDNFKIELLKQYWIDNSPDDGKDLCSHGKVLLSINNKVLCNENSGSWTVASSALRLMKSAICGYDSISEYQLLPCCGYLRMFPSCNRYITWDTKIYNDIIAVSNIQCSEGGEDSKLQVIDNIFEIEYLEYAKQVLIFAKDVINFYSSSLPREFYDQFDEDEYGEFWKEFNKYYQIMLRICSEKKIY